uniref:Neur_chan_LBD domain-containing protein n=1 Tax=Haemonchus placei TaxID=6290 RepID=A0A0N4X4Q3_HAEPC
LWGFLVFVTALFSYSITNTDILILTLTFSGELLGRIQPVMISSLGTLHYYDSATPDKNHNSYEFTPLHPRDNSGLKLIHKRTFGLIGFRWSWVFREDCRCAVIQLFDFASLVPRLSILDLTITVSSLKLGASSVSLTSGSNPSPFFIFCSTSLSL